MQTTIARTIVKDSFLLVNSGPGVSVRNFESGFVSQCV